MSQPTLSIGTKLFGKEITYMVTQILGQGSFGITYKVKAFTIVKGSFGEERYEFPQPKAVKEFFMKELNGRTESGSVTGISSGSLSYNYAQKFRSEAGNLAKMKHQNIVRVIDFIEANGTYYYVMDYVEGENLNEYIKHNKLTENEVVDIIRKVADALIYMHEEQKMLHLDLKPGNIMRRSSDGHIFLIDFGLSKHFSDNGTPETSTTVGFGTAGYAPVEQSNGTASAQFRPTIDVYALGATMYKLLTGETPPMSPDLMNDEGFIKDSLNRYSVSKKVAKVIIKAMSPKFKDRQQSVKEFVKGLPEVKQNEFGEREYTDTTDNSNKDDETRTEDTEPIVEVVPDEQKKRGLLHSLVARYTQRYEERHIVTNIVLYGIQIVSLLSLIVLGVVMIHLSRTYRYLVCSIPLALLLVSLLISNTMILRWKKKGLFVLFLLLSVIPFMPILYTIWHKNMISECEFFFIGMFDFFVLMLTLWYSVSLFMYRVKGGTSTWDKCKMTKKPMKIISVVLFSLSQIIILITFHKDKNRYFEGDLGEKWPASFDVVQLEIPDNYNGKYVIPYGTNYIINYAFCISDITSVVVPSTVNEIGKGAFSKCESLEKAIIHNGVSSIKYCTFEDCTSLVEITLPNSVETIGIGAFFRCISLVEITLPNGVETIGNSAFENCASLVEITLPNSLKIIGEDAFENCTSLVEITFPNSIDTIGSLAFCGCRNLKTVTILSRNATIDMWPFFGCEQLKTIYVPVGTKDYYVNQLGKEYRRKIKEKDL